MIPRTKHIVIASSLAVGIAFVYLWIGVVDAHVPSFSQFGQEASVIQSDEQVYEVAVLEDGTRAEVGARLKEKLRAYVEESRLQEKEPIEESQPLVTPEEDEEEVVVPSPIQWCDSGATVLTRNTWGPVTVHAAEGARIISSLQRDDSGAPLHTLQLPLEPTLASVEGCLPSSMIGILLDGTVVLPGVPVTTDAEGLAGYAIDGFPLFSSYENGKTVTSGDLDVCHGHAHTIVDQGVQTEMYHYHVTTDAPYTLGCLRGVQ